MRHFLKMGDFCHTSLFLSREDFSVEYAKILRNCGRKKMWEEKKKKIELLEARRLRLRLKIGKLVKKLF